MKMKVAKRLTIVSPVWAVMLLAQPRGMCHGFFSHPVTLLCSHPHEYRRSALRSTHLEPLTTSPILSTSLDADRRIGKTRLYSLLHKIAHHDDDSAVPHSGVVRFWTRIPRMLKIASKIFFARQRKIKNSLAVEGDSENQGRIHGAAVSDDIGDQVSSPATTPFQQSGTRWAMAATTTQLSGNWRPIVTPAFRKIYDEYLQNCSEPLLPRKLITSLLHTTREVIDHSGRNLTITSTNPAGTWSRTLISSGAENTLNREDYDVVFSEIIDPYKESVTVESWWDHHGTVHRSVLRGKSRVCGGTFETLRYLEENDPFSTSDSVVDKSNNANDILIVESFFHPSSESQGFRNGHVQWRYERE
jgi:hypothetical protein